MTEILRQARNERRFPGDGGSDLLGLLRALPAGIALSVETPNQQLQAQGIGALQRARTALEKTQALLDAL
jgi:hypothetical protein